MSRSSDADIDRMNAQAALPAADGLSASARRSRVCYIRPEGELLLQVGSAFRVLHRNSVAGRFCVDDLREARGVIDQLIAAALRTEVA
jgi:hypothetical protein